MAICKIPITTLMTFTLPIVIMHQASSRQTIYYDAHRKACAFRYSKVLQAAMKPPNLPKTVTDQVKDFVFLQLNVPSLSPKTRNAGLPPEGVLRIVR